VWRAPLLQDLLPELRRELKQAASSPIFVVNSMPIGNPSSVQCNGSDITADP
jgi:hypothetical protein